LQGVTSALSVPVVIVYLLYHFCRCDEIAPGEIEAGAIYEDFLVALDAWRARRPEKRQQQQSNSGALKLRPYQAAAAARIRRQKSESRPGCGGVDR
jgi:hypothetical protein